jgi:riboflavin kinase/FMN adenylyltransferase
MHVYTSLTDIPQHQRLVTVGTFDGVHRGHQALLQHLRQWAQQLSLPACVVTFEPHPRLVLGAQPAFGILTPLPLKLERLRHSGIEEVVLLPFTHEFARTPAEEFVRHYLVETLHMRGILIGHDHMFGHGRRGNKELLQRLGRELGFAVKECPPFVLHDTLVSSSLIRQALRAGEVDRAADLLGYPYTICGTVVRGDGRGRQLGFPTANLLPEDPHQLLPAYGIYIVTTRLEQTTYVGLASYGVRPTFGNGLSPQLEVYLLDFSGELYNERLCVSFWTRVRDERAFPNPEALRQQMEADVAYCRRWIAQHCITEIGSTSMHEQLHGDQGTES